VKGFTVEGCGHVSVLCRSPDETEGRMGLMGDKGDRQHR
jgi:hypothetical protein